MSLLSGLESVVRQLFPPPPPPPPPRQAVHEVQPGETFDQIGARYGVDARTLADANPRLANPDLINPGEQLGIPLHQPGAALPGLLQLESGQTLDQVARQSGTSVDTLMRANGIVNPDTVYPGDRIWVPGADVLPSTPQQSQVAPANAPYNTRAQPLGDDAAAVHRALQGYRAALANTGASDPQLRAVLGPAADTRRDALTAALRNELDALALDGLPSTPLKAGLSDAPLHSGNIDRYAQPILSRYVNDPQAQQLLGLRIADIRVDLQAQRAVPYVSVAPDQATFDHRLGTVMSELTPPAQASLATQPAIQARLPEGYLTPAQEHELAMENPPVMVFHPDENNLPGDPALFIEQSALREELDWRRDNELSGLGEVSPGELAAIGSDNASADGQIFLDHRNEDLGDGIRDGDIDSARMLYEYDPATRTMTYHIFYPYNDGSQGGPAAALGDKQNHEGDWESVTIKYDEHFNPTDVYYSGHGGVTHRSWGDDMTLTADGRPVVYVANGSHANYPETGNWETAVPGIEDVTASSDQTLDLATRSAEDVTAEPWYGSGVLWGERGTTSEIPHDVSLPIGHSGVELPVGDLHGITSGPTGPSPTKLDGILGAIGQADESGEDRQPLP